MSAWSLQGPGGRLVVAPSLEAMGVVRHGVTTRAAGWGLSFRTAPSPERVPQDRAAACALLGAGLADLVMPEQVHGSGVAVVGEGDRGRGAAARETAVPGVDALVTTTPGLLLGIMVADCLPVFLVDPVRRVVGLAHSGWRGAAGRVVPRTLDAMREAGGTDPRDVAAAVGPGIGGDCYEVGDEVRAALTDAGAPAGVLRPSPAGRWLLNLRAVVLAQLAESGVASDRVAVAPWCTHCERSLFHSHRGEGPGAGRMLALLGLLPSKGAAFREHPGGHLRLTPGHVYPLFVCDGPAPPWLRALLYVFVTRSTAARMAEPAPSS